MTGEQRDDQGLDARERDFWNHHVPNVEECLSTLARPPDPNMEAMLDALGDIDGKRVLDFACGAGVTTARLAQRGALVTAVDLSPVSLRRTREVADALGLGHQVTTADSLDGLEPGFHGAVGHWALHHVDVTEVASELSALLDDGSTAAFVETFATNPLLIAARHTLTGRFGIPRFGTPDEHPLTRRDLRALAEIFASVEIAVPSMQFMRIFDRQVTRYRNPAVSRACARIDHLLGRSPHLWFLSYHQVVVCRVSKTATPTPH